ELRTLPTRRSSDLYAAEESEQVENRRLHLSTVEDGSLLINGVLDPAGGAAVRTALEPLARKSGEHDDRVLDQRYADALVELASGGKPANLQVTASVETLKGLAGAAGAEMEFSLPISSTSLQRMACDCSVTRVLLSQESVTIDVGRSKRGDLGRGAQGAGSARWSLPVAGLRATGVPVRRPPRGPLDRRRRHRSRHPGPALSDGPRRRPAA